MNTQVSARKVTLSAFWDVKGLVHLEFMPKDTSMNSECCNETQETEGKDSEGSSWRADGSLPHLRGEYFSSDDVKIAGQISRMHISIVTASGTYMDAGGNV